MQKKQWEHVSTQNKQALLNADSTLGMKVMPTNFNNVSEQKKFNDAREEIVMSLDPRIIPIARKIIDGKLGFEGQNNKE